MHPVETGEEQGSDNPGNLRVLLQEDPISAEASELKGYGSAGSGNGKRAPSLDAEPFITLMKEWEHPEDGGSQNRWEMLTAPNPSPLQRSPGNELLVPFGSLPSRARILGSLARDTSR